MDPSPNPPPAPPPTSQATPAVQSPPGALMPGQTSTGSARKKTTVIVVAVLAVLLLGCAGVGAAGVLYYMKTQNEASTDSDGLLRGDRSIFPDDSGATGTVTEEPVDPAWATFEPAAYDPTVYVTPTARQMGLVEEITVSRYPLFQVEETLLEPGRVENDTYWDDVLYVNASLRESPDVRIALRYSIELDAAKEADLSYDPEDLDQGEAIGTTSDDTEYIWYTDFLAPLQGEDVDSTIVALLEQIAQDFPDSVVLYVSVTDDVAYASITRWEAYPPNEAGVDVDYTRDGDGWRFVKSDQW